MKAFGLALLSLVPILFGFQRRESLLQEGRIKEALIHFFETVRFEIDSFSRPQREIFSRFENRLLEKIGFLPLLRKEVERDPCGALERAVKSLLEEGKFTLKEVQALEEFSENFGMQSKGAQIRDCDKLLSILSSEEEMIKQKRKTDASIAQTLGLCLGIGLFILLI